MLRDLWTQQVAALPRAPAVLLPNCKHAVSTLSFRLLHRAAMDLAALLEPHRGARVLVLSRVSAKEVS